LRRVGHRQLIECGRQFVAIVPWKDTDIVQMAIVIGDLGTEGIE
jgi:hypothetical protein